MKEEKASRLGLERERFRDGLGSELGDETKGGFEFTGDLSFGGTMSGLVAF